MKRTETEFNGAICEIPREKKPRLGKMIQFPGAVVVEEIVVAPELNPQTLESPVKMPVTE